MHRLHQKLEKIEARLVDLRETADDLLNASGPSSTYDREWGHGMMMVIKQIEGDIND